MDRIPQVISITKSGKDNRIPLSNEVRKQFGENAVIRIGIRDGEVILSNRELPESIAVEVTGRSLSLPAASAAYLQLKEGTEAAIIQRENGAAVKRYRFAEKTGAQARLEDTESETELVRTLMTNPKPEQTLHDLSEKYRGLRFQHDPLQYLSDNDSIYGLICRRSIGMNRERDPSLREQLYGEITKSQEPDGSWQSDVILTSRNLREIAEMGITEKRRETAAAAEWLLSGKESPYNPGMFFLSDDLVSEQIRIVEAVRNGSRERFRQVKKSEINKVRKGLDTAHYPCGPRLMWPNAMILRSLLEHGYEEDDRVSRACQFLLNGGWCECSYAHGQSKCEKREVYTAEKISEKLDSMVKEYTYGGWQNPGDVSHMDLTKDAFFLRNSAAGQGNTGVYSLEMPFHQLPCGLMTAWALSKTRNTLLKEHIEAHVWRFAAKQNLNGHFDYKHAGKYFYIDLFALFDIAAAKAALMRSVPWIIEAQNPDGSWGEGDNAGASTLAVVRALDSVKEFLPESMKFQ